MSVITRVAGNGTMGNSGDGGPATDAELYFPVAIASTGDGGFLVSDSGNNVVRAVSAGGVITRVAGNGTKGSGGDGGPATDAELHSPAMVAAIAGGGFLIADNLNHVVRAVSYGVITRVAGNGTQGNSGDGGPATDARLTTPYGVALTADGGFLISDSGSHVVRKVSASGVITTVAGNGTQGNSGDGGPATDAQLNAPATVAVTADGGFLIADADNYVVRKVSAGGVITTVAGNGTQGSSGDGGPATDAQLYFPVGVAATRDGAFLIADYLGNVVRAVSSGGVINSIAGNGTQGNSGDGGPAIDAQLYGPYAVTVTAESELVLDFLIADSSNNEVRAVSIGPVRWPFPVEPVIPI